MKVEVVAIQDQRCHLQMICDFFVLRSFFWLDVLLKVSGYFPVDFLAPDMSSEFSFCCRSQEVA